MICTNIKVEKEWVSAHVEEEGIGSMDVKLSRVDKNSFELSNIVGDELKLRWACRKLLELCEQFDGHLDDVMEI